MAAVKACMACTDDLLLESGVLLWNHEDREKNVGGTSAFVLPGDSTEELGVGIPVVSALELCQLALLGRGVRGATKGGDDGNGGRVGLLGPADRCTGGQGVGVEKGG